MHLIGREADLHERTSNRIGRSVSLIEVTGEVDRAISDVVRGVRCTGSSEHRHCARCKRDLLGRSVSPIEVTDDFDRADGRIARGEGRPDRREGLGRIRESACARS